MSLIVTSAIIGLLAGFTWTWLVLFNDASGGPILGLKYLGLLALGVIVGIIVAWLVIILKQYLVSG